MNVDNVKSQMRKGMLEYCILLLLHREHEWVESTQGPPRKYYKLTSDGEGVLSELETAWDELSNTVNHLRNELLTIELK